MITLKNKLLIVGAFPPPDKMIFGGIVTTCRALLDSSFQNYFELAMLDSTQISNPPPSLPKRFLGATGRLAKFIKLLITFRPEAVLLFTAFGASVLEKGVMAWFARFTGVPVLIFPRGAALIEAVEASAFAMAWVKLSLCGADYMLCQGPTWQRFAVRKIGFSPARAPIVKNWSATEALLTIGDKRSIPDQESMPTLLFLAWLEREKGIFELLEAVVALSKQHAFKLIIAGRGNAEDEARTFVETNLLQDRVDFVGWIKEDAKGSLLRSADILVLPSWVEGFPNAIIEAMAAKLAVIVTAVGNVPDLIEHQKQALVIPPKDIKSLRAAIETLIIDPELRWHLAQSGNAFAKQNFSVERGIKRLTKVIKTAIIKRSGSSCAA